MYKFMLMQILALIVLLLRYLVANEKVALTDV